MFCEACLSLKRSTPGSARQPVPAAGVTGARPDETCEQCGRLLDGDVGERLAAKVSQLARFGLAGRPLLSRRRS